jgi:acetyl-CoA carboxylase biotin carboxyl carrier protein
MPPFDIDADTIRKLADLMTETGISEIEMAEGERSIRVSRASSASIVHAPPRIETPGSSTPAPVTAPPVNNAGVVVSPMVGTAYLKPEPGAAPFASVGDSVKIGDTLLIIEAMKVMNPIKAPHGGVVKQILVSDGQPVEYGEPMMIIE